MNKNNLYTSDGHIADWVFYPPAWGSNDYWAETFSDTEKQALFDHMKQCRQCSQLEIESTLRWAEQRPRARASELMLIPSAGTPDEELASFQLFDNYPKYLRKQILQYAKGRLILFARDEDGRVSKITGTTDNKIESETVFIYDGITTSILCHCDKCEDGSPFHSEKNILF